MESTVDTIIIIIYHIYFEDCFGVEIQDRSASTIVENNF